MRRARRVLVAALAALALTGCSGLPGSGPVTEGRRLGDSIQEPVRVSVQGPTDGASPLDIARGFVHAGEDSDETRATGTEFLAPQSVDLWRWSTQDVLVYDSAAAGLTARLVGPELVEVSTVAVARVTSQGRYLELAPGTVARARFGVTKVGGEWRLELPITGFGLWLDTNAFDRLYTNRNVFFVTPSGRRLVPDSRWFPNGSRLATTLARAQLDPVPAYLAGAVASGVPSGTQLAVNAVPVDNGRAQVNLSAVALEADPDDRTAMWAQLTATLLQVPSVSEVTLAVEGTNLELPSGGTTATAPDLLGFEQGPTQVLDTALVREGGALIRIDPTFIPDKPVAKRLPDTKPQPDDVKTIPDRWAALGLSSDEKQVAAVSADGRELSLWSAGADSVMVRRFATEMTRPAYDPDGYLWVAGADARGSFRIYAVNAVARTDARPVAVPAPWLAGRRVVTLTVSGEGSRLLVVTTKADGTDPQLGISGIRRAPNGQPTSLGVPWRQAEPLTAIRDAVWLDATTYAVLGRLGGAQTLRPWIGTIGAGLEGIRRRGNPNPAGSRLAPVPTGSSITTVGGPRGIIVVTSDGQVLARTGASWRRIAAGTDVLVPGR